jgi:hypothetical protein
MMWAAVHTNQARPAPPLAAAEMSSNGGELGQHVCIRPLQVGDVDVDVNSALLPASWPCLPQSARLRDALSTDSGHMA